MNTHTHISVDASGGAAADAASDSGKEIKKIKK
jgi:hypothetical protein